MGEYPLAPLVLFVYNRPWHTQQTVEALLRNKLASQSELYVYSDGPRGNDALLVEQVRHYVHSIRGFKQVVVSESETNQGLANSVIRGVTSVLSRHEKVIVLEDDMVCTTDFLDFMNQALNFYQHDSRIFSVSGYSYPVVIPEYYPYDVCVFPRASSWGWGTWADRWQKVDWEVLDFEQFMRDPKAKAAFKRGGEDLLAMLVKQQMGKINSWAIRWTYAHSKHQAYCLSPVKQKMHSIGTDGSGTHLRKTNRYAVPLTEGNVRLDADVREDEQLLKSLQAFFRLSPIRRVINFLTLR